jgi:hypothetical protein
MCILLKQQSIWNLWSDDTPKIRALFGVLLYVGLAPDIGSRITHYKIGFMNVILQRCTLLNGISPNLVSAHVSPTGSRNERPRLHRNNQTCDKKNSKMNIHTGQKS